VAELTEAVSRLVDDVAGEGGTSPSGG
jgi:hypothetical protein